jgi:hypothetical protein
MSVKDIETGKWIRIVRISLLGNMSQPHFAKWLSKETEENISSQLVARMENWGRKDTSRKVKPSNKVISVIQSIAPWGPSSNVPVVSRSIKDEDFTTLSFSEHPNNYFGQSYSSGVGNITSPIYFYYPALWRPVIQENSTFRYSTNTSSSRLQVSGFVIKVVSADSGDPLDNANVIAFTNFVRKEGTSNRTDANGEVTLLCNSPVIERLFVHSPLSGHWGYCGVDTPFPAKEQRK